MSYFSSGDERAEGAPRIVRAADLQKFAVSEGIDIEPVLGARLNINVVTLRPDAVAQVHSHAEEQIGYVVSGSCEFTDGETTWSLEPGDCYHAPPGTPHGARAFGGGCVVVDAFAPPRAGVREMLEDHPKP